jgi:hypothetical protein
MLKPSTALFHPAVAGRVLRQALGLYKQAPQAKEAPAQAPRPAAVPVRH